MNNNKLTNKLKVFLICFVFYIFVVYLHFSFAFTMNKNYYENSDIASKNITETEKKSVNDNKNVKNDSNSGSNNNENGIDKSKLSTKINTGNKVGNVLSDEEVIASLQQKNDKDVNYILENRESLTINYMRLLNSNINSKHFIKDVIENKKPLSFEGESVEFSRNIPYFLQWDRRWGTSYYADGNIGINGCGPTCLAMVVSGLNKDKSITPETLAKHENDKYTQLGGTTWDYFREVPDKYNIKVKELPTDKNVYFNELKKGNPIIVNVGIGDFTSVGHYVVLVALEDEYIIINDPNSPDRSNEKWTFERLAPQVKNAWAYSKER